MKLTQHKLGTVAAVLTLAFTLSSTPTITKAITSSGEATTERATVTQEQPRSKIETERREAANEKLSAAKLKACENHAERIAQRMTRISERTTKHLAVFDKISERTQAFYTNKGKVLTNYDELVATVAAKRAAAEAAIATVDASKGEFSCDGANPKQTVESFRANLKSSIVALKEYRTAIKNLIVGVKSVNGSQSTQTNRTEEAQ